LRRLLLADVGHANTEARSSAVVQLGHLTLRVFPLGEYATDRLINLCAGVSSFMSCCEKLIIWRLCVSNMCGNGEANCGLVEFLGSTRTTDTTTVFEAHMFSDNPFPPRGAAWKRLSNAAGKTLKVFAIQLRSPRGLALSPLGSGFLVGQALDFGSL
jgi:hypothetical protein